MQSLHCFQLQSGLHLLQICSHALVMPVCVCVMQKYAIDFQALSCAFAATIVPPLTSMSPNRPPLRVGIAPNFVLIAMMVLLFIVSDVISLAFLCTRSWYQGGNGTADKVNCQLLHVVSCVAHRACSVWSVQMQGTARMLFALQQLQCRCCKSAAFSWATHDMCDYAQLSCWCLSCTTELCCSFASTLAHFAISIRAPIMLLEMMLSVQTHKANSSSLLNHSTCCTMPTSMLCPHAEPRQHNAMVECQLPATGANHQSDCRDPAVCAAHLSYSAFADFIGCVYHFC